MAGLHAAVRFDAAIRFAAGEYSDAMQRICQHAIFWRGLRRRTDMLIVDAIAVLYLSGAASGYAEMLAALPSDEAPPPSCEPAFAPLAEAEFDLCRVVRGEFRMADNSLRTLTAHAKGDLGWSDRLVRALGYRHGATMARVAPAYAEFCSPSQQQRAARREDAPMMHGEPCSIGEWPFNAIGCSLGGHAPDYSPYYHRLLDLDGHLRTVASAQWLRDQQGIEPGIAFDQRPGGMRDERILLEGDVCARTLSFDARVPRAGAPTWRIPVYAPEVCPSVLRPH